MRAEQGPGTVFFHTFHKQVRYPKRREEISCPHFFFTVVLTQVEEIFDIRMPCLEIDSKGTFALTTTLIDITGCIIEHAQHRNNTVAHAIGTFDIAACSTDVVDVKTDTTGRLGDHGTTFQGLEDTIDAVFLHA